MGSSSTSSSGVSRMKPRASASFCHWPKLTSAPSGQVGPSWVSRPDGSRSTSVVAPARATRGRDRALVVEPVEVAEADGGARR